MLFKCLYPSKQSYQRMQSVTLFASFLLISMISGCGGSSQPAPALIPATPSNAGTSMGTAQSGWVQDQFDPSVAFKNRCVSPRSASTDILGTRTDQNNWLRSWSNELYLWYDEITDINPADFTTTDYFDRMRSLETTSSGALKDKFHC